MTISLCDLRPMTKTLPVDSNFCGNQLQSAFANKARVYRSADSSPAEVRRVVDELEEDFEGNNNDNIGQVGQANVSPAAAPPLRQQLIVDVPLVVPVSFCSDLTLFHYSFQPQQRYMTYAETRARLRQRERRPIQRVPVGQGHQNAPAAAAQTRRRARRSALRYFRRAAEDQQVLLDEAQPAPRPAPAIVVEPNLPIERQPRNLPPTRHVRFRNEAAGAAVAIPGLINF